MSVGDTTGEERGCAVATKPLVFKNDEGEDVAVHPDRVLIIGPHKNMIGYHSVEITWGGGVVRFATKEKLATLIKRWQGAM